MSRNHYFNPDRLAEDAAEDKIKTVNDELLCEWLQEIGGYPDRRTFMELLAAVRKNDWFAMGSALRACLLEEALRGIDGNELAHQAEADARQDAFESNRDAVRFNREHP